MSRLLHIAGVLVALSFGWSGLAMAHAALVSVAPADGSIVDRAPSVLELAFSEAVTPTALHLIGPDGTSLPLASVKAADSSLIVETPPDAGPGTYVISWRVVSDDGHPVGGSSLFSIGHASATRTNTAGASVDLLLNVGIWLTTLAIYLGVFIGIGGSAFCSGNDDKSPILVTMLRTIILTALLAAALSVGLQGADAGGTGLASLIMGGVWRAGASTSYGGAVLAIVTASIFALLSLGTRGASSKALSFAACATVCVGFLASGHASTADPRWLMRAALTLHVLGVLYWVGALVPIALMLWQRSPAAERCLAKFSSTIPAVLCLLLASGAVLAVVQVQKMEALWSTPYGLVLLTKLALVAGVLVLAAYNRWGLTRLVLRCNSKASRRLIQVIVVETALLACILGVASAWRFTPPPRAQLSEGAAQTASIEFENGDLAAHLMVDGQATCIMVFAIDGSAIASPQSVTLSMSSRELDIEPIKRKAVIQADGTWALPDFSVPVPGVWQLKVDILVNDFDQVTMKRDTLL